MKLDQTLLHLKDAWLAPNGTVYPVKPAGHSCKASEIVKKDIDPNYEEPTLLAGGSEDAEQILERRGWIKLTYWKWYFLPLGGGIYKDGLKLPEITQSQKDVIFDWCQINEIKYPPDYVDADLG
jgi:hypothetical protein